MRKNKWTLILGALICFFAIGIIYMFVGDDGQAPNKTADDRKGQIVEFTGADLHETKDGKDVWRVTAQKILYNTETKEALLTDMEVLFQQDGKTLRVLASKGRIDGNKTVIEMEGTVQATSTDGVKFEGKNLHFDNKQKVLTAKDGFIFTRDDTKIVGDILTADMVMESVTAKGHVRMSKGEKE